MFEQKKSLRIEEIEIRGRYKEHGQKAVETQHQRICILSEQKKNEWKIMTQIPLNS